MNGRYFEHPTADIACIECSEFILRHDTFLMPFSQKRILDWSTSELYPGQQVFFVGYPDMIRDELHNLPIVRTATQPAKKVSLANELNMEEEDETA
ncbi:hypothetical protein BCO9919_05994 [Burkholderia cenocepacia]|uniref:Uncharacterized protein n=2 Tax=Burkholderia TaxID=32008 RepID=A0A6J5JPQ5_9BURK|nr:hypothetical protein BCO9919_05994 [Burkholderia cenocepacia]